MPNGCVADPTGTTETTVLAPIIKTPSKELVAATRRSLARAVTIQNLTHYALGSDVVQMGVLDDAFFGGDQTSRTTARPTEMEASMSPPVLMASR